MPSQWSAKFTICLVSLVTKVTDTCTQYQANSLPCRLLTDDIYNITAVKSSDNKAVAWGVGSKLQIQQYNSIPEHILIKSCGSVCVCMCGRHVSTLCSMLQSHALSQNVIQLWFTICTFLHLHMHCWKAFSKIASMGSPHCQHRPAYRERNTAWPCVTTSRCFMHLFPCRTRWFSGKTSRHHHVLPDVRLGLLRLLRRLLLWLCFHLERLEERSQSHGQLPATSALLAQRFCNLDFQAWLMDEKMKKTWLQDTSREVKR